MTHRNLATAASLLSLSAISCADPLGSSGVQQFGAVHDRNHYSWAHTVQIKRNLGSRVKRCTAAVIAETWLLTNQHCVNDGEKVTAYFNKEFEASAPIDGIAHVHPNAQMGKKHDLTRPVNDLALVQLQGRIPGSHRPAPLLKSTVVWPGKSHKDYSLNLRSADIKAKSVGFGQTESGSQGTFGYANLKLAEMRTRAQVFVAVPEGDKPAGGCFGDSGGPLFVEFPGQRYALAGLVFGFSGSTCGHTTWAIDLTKQIDWITSKVGSGLILVDGLEAGESAGLAIPQNEQDPSPDDLGEHSGTDRKPTPPTAPEKRTHESLPPGEGERASPSDEATCAKHTSRTACVLQAGDTCKWIGFSGQGSCVPHSMEADIDFSVLPEGK